MTVIMVESGSPGIMAQAEITYLFVHNSMSIHVDYSLFHDVPDRFVQAGPIAQPNNEHTEQDLSFHKMAGLKSEMAQLKTLISQKIVDSCLLIQQT